MDGLKGGIKTEQRRYCIKGGGKIPPGLWAAAHQQFTGKGSI